MKLGQFISGSVVHRYWERYTHHLEMPNKIRFENKVKTAEHQEGRLDLDYEKHEGG